MSEEKATHPLTVSDAIGIRKGDVVSLVGGGGKTTTMYCIANELARRGNSVIITTTTHIWPPDDHYDTLFSQDTKEVEKVLNSKKMIVLATAFDSTRATFKGIDPLWVSELAKIADNIIIEADGARTRPFKAPADHEPVIPPSSTIVLPVVGMDAVYKPLSAEWSHRTEKIAELAGVKPGDTVTPEIIARTVIHPMGGRKGVPEKAFFIPLLNKADSTKKIDIARDIAGCLKSGGIPKIIITSHKKRPIFIESVM